MSMVKEVELVAAEQWWNAAVGGREWKRVQALGDILNQILVDCVKQPKRFDELPNWLQESVVDWLKHNGALLKELKQLGFNGRL